MAPAVSSADLEHGWTLLVTVPGLLGMAGRTVGTLSQGLLVARARLSLTVGVGLDC